MRKSLVLIIVLLCLLAWPILSPVAEELKESPLQAVLMGSGWTDNNFSEGLSGGITAGIQTSLDADRGLWLRVLYSRYNFGPSEAGESISISALMDWYLGKKWKFYLDFGPEFNVAGPLSGTDYFTSVGASRRLWTSDDPNLITQAHLDGFLEISFNDGSEQTSGNYLQLNIGLKFGRPIYSP